MSFWSKGKANVSLAALNNQLKKAILAEDDKEVERLRQAIKDAKAKQQSGKKTKPMSKKKSMVG